MSDRLVTITQLEFDNPLIGQFYQALAEAAAYYAQFTGQPLQEGRLFSVSIQLNQPGHPSYTNTRTSQIPSSILSLYIPDLLAVKNITSPEHGELGTDTSTV